LGDLLEKRPVVFNGLNGKIYGTLYGNSSVWVLLCPPHPLYGGSKDDFRLVFIAQKLAKNGIGALCIDYHGYSYGVKEVDDVLSTILYLRNKTNKVGLIGYSFGAVVASIASTKTSVKGLVLMSLLKKVNGLEANINSPCPKLFIHGRYDTIAPYTDFENLYNEAKGNKKKIILETDHFYLEKNVLEHVSEEVYKFFTDLFF